METERRRTGRRAAAPRAVRRRGARRDARARRRDRAPAPVRAAARRARPRRRRARPTRSSPAARAARCAACRSPSRTRTGMAGVPTTLGIDAPSSRSIPVETVAAVRRLEEAGAVIFAKTATPEFCYAGTTPGTHNPHDPTQHARAARPAAPRSRSPPAPARSRSAATAAARSASRPRSAASSASSRRSAPSRASRRSAGWKTLVAYGPLARSVADARLMFCGPRRPRPATIATACDVDLDRDPIALRRLRRPRHARRRRPRRASAQSCAQLGVDLGLARTCRRPRATWATIATAEARWAEAEPFEQRPEALGPHARAFLAAGDAVTTDVYLARADAARAHPPRVRASSSPAPACC